MMKNGKILNILGFSFFQVIFKIMIFLNRKYEIKVKHRPTIPDNIKYWQVFEDDKHVEIFLQMSDEFASVNIDDECCCDKDRNMAARGNDDPF